MTQTTNKDNSDNMSNVFTVTNSADKVFEDNDQILESDIKSCIRNRRARLGQVSTRYARIQRVYLDKNKQIRSEIKELLAAITLSSHHISDIFSASNHVLVHIKPKTTTNTKITNDVYNQIFSALKKTLDTAYSSDQNEIQEGDFVLVDDENDLIFSEDCHGDKFDSEKNFDVDKFKDFEKSFDSDLNSDNDSDLDSDNDF